MHAQETIHVENPPAANYNTEEVQKLLTEKCEACGAGFTTVRGLNVHQRQHCGLYRRMDKSEYEVEKVLAARGGRHQNLNPESKISLNHANLKPPNLWLW